MREEAIDTTKMATQATPKERYVRKIDPFSGLATYELAPESEMPKSSRSLHDHLAREEFLSAYAEQKECPETWKPQSPNYVVSEGTKVIEDGWKPEPPNFVTTGVERSLIEVTDDPLKPRSGLKTFVPVPKYGPSTIIHGIDHSDTVDATAMAIHSIVNRKPTKAIKCVIVDIDGTLADPTHRRHFVEKSPKDWDNFLREDLVERDTLIEPVANLVHMLHEHYQVIYVTGRNTKHMELTIRWLRANRMWLYPFKLFCRADNDKRSDDVVKREILNELRANGYHPVYAIDDRDRVVKMWREEGLTCLQVAPGDF